MLKKIRRLLLKLNPPKKGDEYAADALFFVLGRAIEQVLFGMTDKFGNRLYDSALGDDSYRIVISSEQSTYFVCQVYTLCTDSKGSFIWLKRSQPRRFRKEMFKDMIVNGDIVKVTS